MGARERSFMVWSKQTGMGFHLRFSWYHLLLLPASVGGVRKQESRYNVNCEVSDEAHCCASCCVLAVPLDPAASGVVTRTERTQNLLRLLLMAVQNYLHVLLSHFSPCSRSLLAQQSVLSSTAHLRDAASFIQPLNIPLREVVNLTLLWK